MVKIGFKHKKLLLSIDNGNQIFLQTTRQDLLHQ
jgi:hypothetical protein